MSADDASLQRTADDAETPDVTRPGLAPVGGGPPAAEVGGEDPGAVSPALPTPAQPAANDAGDVDDIDPASSGASAATSRARAALRRWRRIRPAQVVHAGRDAVRRAVTVPVDETPATVTVAPTVEAPAPVVAEPATPRLLKMSPFTIGFVGAAGAIAALWLWAILNQIQGIIVVVVVSLFLALGLNPLVEAIERFRIKRWIAVLLVILGLAGVIALGSSALFPVLAEQVQTLINHLPSYLSGLRQNPQFAHLDAKYSIVKQVTDIVASKDTWSNVFGGILGASKMLANTFGSTVVCIVLTLYFLSSLPQIKAVIYQLAPASKRPRARQLADETFRRVGGYLSGMFIDVSCAAIGAFVMMNIIGLGQYALALAFVVALFAFIPLIGNSVSMVLIATIALSISWQAAVIVIVYFLVYMQIDAYFIQPRIMARSVEVPGAITVVAALAGGSLLGIVGALIAIPTAAVLLLFYREILVPHLDRT